MGMLLRIYFVQPCCFIVEESKAFMRVKRTFLMSQQVGRAEAGPRNLLSWLVQCLLVTVEKKLF